MTETICSAQSHASSERPGWLARASGGAVPLLATATLAAFAARSVAAATPRSLTTRVVSR